MKNRSIYKLNNKIKNYLCIFIIIFIVSSILSFCLFFWSVSAEVNEKAKTWGSYFTERIIFLEDVIASRTTVDHGITSILKVLPEGEIINSRPFPIDQKNINNTELLKVIKDYVPGEVHLIKEPGRKKESLKKNFLVMRMDYSFFIADIPAKSLLPVQPHDTELFIKDKDNHYFFFTEDQYNIKEKKINGLIFSGMHVFATAKAKPSRFDEITIYLAEDISPEFYVAILLLTMTAICLAIILKRSTFLTSDLNENENDFARIGRLLARVSKMPDKNMSHIPAIEYTAENIRKVDWDAEIAAMSFSENREYIAATAFFSNNILELLDKITEHSKDIAKSRQEYHDLVQTARSIILRIDLSGTCTFFNEYAQSFFGFPENEILGQPVVGTIIPKTSNGDSEIEIIMKSIGDLIEKRPTGTNQNVCKDGSIVCVYWSNSPIYDKKGNLVEILSVGTDVTAKTIAESELEKTRNYIKNIIDSMPSAIIGLNSEKLVTQFNITAQKMSAVPVNRIVGAHIDEAFPSISKYSDRISKAIETAIPETGIRTQDILNPESYQDIIIYPLTGGLKGAVVRIDDSTERVRIEEMMIQTEKMMSVGGLAAGMAHEINNPLGGIIQGIQNIIRRMSPDIPANIKAAEKAGCTLNSIHSYMEDRKIIKTLEGITESGIRAAKIVSGMLEFSRKSDSRKAPCDLRKMMDKAEVLATQDYDLGKKYDFKKIKIIKQYDENLSLTNCTETEIEQVFLNLLRNSAQAMAEWDQMPKQPEISIKIKNCGDVILCSISDNGPGMSETTRKRVFEPFYTTKSPGSGTGLGLSVSYFIITQNHRGKFNVHSSPRKGTTFNIILPVKNGCKF